MGFQVLGIWIFRGLLRSRDSRGWLVGTITKMEKAYANLNPRPSIRNALNPEPSAAWTLKTLDPKPSPSPPPT